MNRYKQEQNNNPIEFAIDILLEKRLSVVHENLDAWMILCHAVFYLREQLLLEKQVFIANSSHLK